ncbi:hypothetical protein GLA29479_415 [Lysobacter antibioticus]|nr:hypothetical protein GLA29479_415 [Lysobacter antibioticus]
MADAGYWFAKKREREAGLRKQELGRHGATCLSPDRCRLNPSTWSAG